MSTAPLKTTPRLFTSRQVQDALQVTRQSLWVWRRQGLLVPVTLGRSLRYRAEDIDEVMKNGLRPKKRQGRRR